MPKKKRYTNEEFLHIKATVKSTLNYGRTNIIGKYEFKHAIFNGKPGIFTKNSFTENLRYGGGFKEKAGILQHIDTLLKTVVYSHYSVNYKPNEKPKVDGYFIFNGTYHGRGVEYLFENRRDGHIVFYFIRLEKTQNRTKGTVPDP
jgi:hypothetical protein